jgi:trk system potassium uptake protein TrkA
MTGMTQWWQWQSSSAQDVSNSFAVIGVGRFGSAVCRELLRAGAEVLAIDLNARAIDELLQDETGIEARIVDCTDEDALREAGALDAAAWAERAAPVRAALDNAATAFLAGEGGPRIDFSQPKGEAATAFNAIAVELLARLAKKAASVQPPSV